MPYKDPQKQKEAQRASYERNRISVIERSRRKRKADREWLDSLKVDPCFICGGNFPPCAMDFHHKDPAQKKMSVSFAITKMGRSKVLEEIEKCELICANCHRVLEYGD